MSNRELTESELNGVAAGHHHHGGHNEPKAPIQNQTGAAGQTTGFTWDLQANKAE